MPIDPTHLRVLEERIERIIEHLRSREPAAAAELEHGRWQARSVGYRSDPGEGPIRSESWMLDVGSPVLIRDTTLAQELEAAIRAWREAWAASAE